MLDMKEVLLCVAVSVLVAGAIALACYSAQEKQTTPAPKEIANEGCCPHCH